MIEPLDARRIAAVAALWQRERHEVETSFAGDSMRPSIAPGESLRLRFGDGEDYGVGDVVMAISDPYVIVHRIIARGKTWVLMQGDNTLVPDPPVAPSQIFARVIDGDRALAPVTKHERVRAIARAIAIFMTKIHPRAGRAVIVAMRRVAALSRA